MKRLLDRAYRRKKRVASIFRQKTEMLRWDREHYQHYPELNLSFEDYLRMDPYEAEKIRRVGIYAKRKYHAGSGSSAHKAWIGWSFYSPKDIRSAISALDAYNEFEIQNSAAHRTEAVRKANNSDRKSAKRRKLF